jgi:hypothetical protein
MIPPAIVIVAQSELEKANRLLESAGLYPTLVLAGLAVVVLALVLRLLENAVRHLHGKPYLPLASPRFILTVAGCALVVDGFLLAVVFESRLPLYVATVTTSAGLLCLIASAALSVAASMRRQGQR